MIESEYERRKGRYKTIAEVPFSDLRSAELRRDLVISTIGRRVVIGQRLTFSTDDGRKSSAFLRNSPSLSREEAQRLIEALQQACREIER